MGHKIRKGVTYAFVFKTYDAPMQRIRMEKLEQVVNGDWQLSKAFAGSSEVFAKLIVYDDSDPKESTFLLHPEALPCLSSYGPYYKSAFIVALPASEFKHKSPSPLALKAVEVMDHCFDETGVAFDDGDIAPGMTWAREVLSERGGTKKQVLVAGKPQSREAKELYASSCFDGISDTIRRKSSRFFSWHNQDDFNRFMEKMSFGYEDSTAYSKWATSAHLNAHSLSLRFFDDADAPDDESLIALSSLRDKIDGMLSIWACGLRGAADPCFYDNPDDDPEEPSGIEELGRILGVDKMMKAYYSGVALEDIVDQRYIDIDD